MIISSGHRGEAVVVLLCPCTCIMPMHHVPCITTCCASVLPCIRACLNVPAPVFMCQGYCAIVSCASVPVPLCSCACASAYKHVLLCLCFRAVAPVPVLLCQCTLPLCIGASRASVLMYLCTCAQVLLCLCFCAYVLGLLCLCRTGAERTCCGHI